MDQIQVAVEYARVQGMSDAAIAQTVKAEVDRLRFAEAPVDAVTLVHPGLPGQPITVLADAVGFYEPSGWQRDAAPTAEPAPPAEPPAEPAKTSRTVKKDEE